jgi:hypothetical protein
MKWRLLLLVAVGLVISLAACGDDDPDQSVSPGDEVFRATFDEPGMWEEATYPAGAGSPQSTLAIVDGRYRIDHQAVEQNSFAWGASTRDTPENVIIEVEAQQLSGGDGTLYGIVCRAASDPQGELSGYTLLISGDGHYGIATLERDVFAEAPFLTFLLEWEQSDAIKQGDAVNSLRAECVGDYLALYANGEFLGDVTDDTYRRPGKVGLLVGGDEGSSTSVVFDDVTVLAGSLD